MDCGVIRDYSDCNADINFLEQANTRTSRGANRNAFKPEFNGDPPPEKSKKVALATHIPLAKSASNLRSLRIKEKTVDRKRSSSIDLSKRSSRKELKLPRCISSHSSRDDLTIVDSLSKAKSWTKLDSIRPSTLPRSMTPIGKSGLVSEDQVDGKLTRSTGKLVRKTVSLLPSPIIAHLPPLPVIDHVSKQFR